MSNDRQSKQFSPTPAKKKVWNAPKIEVLNLRDAQLKGSGLSDRGGFRSH